MANGRRDWWNQGQDVAPKKMDTMDIVSQLAQWGGQMAQMAETGKKNKRAHFLTMADAMTKGFEAEFDNNKIQDSISKLDKFYNDRADKYDLETQDAYKVYKDKMTAQLNENVEFDSKMKEWEGFSETSEQFINDMYQYSTLGNDAEKKVFIDRDFAYQDAIKNNELGPLVATKTNELERYEAWQTDNMKKTISDYGAHTRNFGAKFYDRIPRSVELSMADTQYYMNDILKGWVKDGNIDNFEYQAWSGLVKNGDDQALKDLNSGKEKIIDTQMQQANKSLTDNVSLYNQNENLIKIGRYDAKASEVAAIFGGNAVPAHIGVGAKEEVSVPRSWWKNSGELNDIAANNEKGVESEQYRQASEKSKVAAKFWEPIETQQIQLQESIEKGNKILNSFGVMNSLETAGYTGIQNEETEANQQELDELKKRAYKGEAKSKDLDIDNNFKETSKTINYIKTGYKDTNRLKWVKDITRKGDVETVKKSGRDRWYKEKLLLINGLIKQHGDDWAKAYNQFTDAEGMTAVHKFGALPISVDKLYNQEANTNQRDTISQYLDSQPGGQ